MGMGYGVLRMNINKIMKVIRWAMYLGGTV
jgi:hypothetical protein